MSYNGDSRYKKYRSSFSLFTPKDEEWMENYPLSYEDNEYKVTHTPGESEPKAIEFSDDFLKDIEEIIRMVEQSENTDKRSKER